jgi:hypothetical protein
LVLRWIEPNRGVERFYSVLIERELFGTIRLVRNWGRIGTNGRELVECSTASVRSGWRLKRWLGRSGSGAIGICDGDNGSQRVRGLNGTGFSLCSKRAAFDAS